MKKTRMPYAIVVLQVQGGKQGIEGSGEKARKKGFSESAQGSVEPDHTAGIQLREPMGVIEAGGDFTKENHNCSSVSWPQEAGKYPSRMWK